MQYIVDAHAVLWFLERDASLGEDARRLLRSPGTRLVAPTIVLAEIWWSLLKKGQEDVWVELVRRLDEDSWIEVYPLTMDVLRLIRTGLEMHDAIICATASLLTETGEDVAVMTRDKQIRESGLVQIIW